LRIIKKIIQIVTAEDGKTISQMFSLKKKSIFLRKIFCFYKSKVDPLRKTLKFLKHLEENL